MKHRSQRINESRHIDQFEAPRRASMKEERLMGTECASVCLPATWGPYFLNSCFPFMWRNTVVLKGPFFCSPGSFFSPTPWVLPPPLEPARVTQPIPHRSYFDSEDGVAMLFLKLWYTPKRLYSVIPQDYSLCTVQFYSLVKPRSHRETYKQSWICFSYDAQFCRNLMLQ
jgi:hypothetical protein